MGKFGKKNEISLNPLDYNICLLGEGGIGKSTLAKEMCEKLVGEDGYLHLDIGREDGAAAIQGIITEKIEDWAKLKEVVDDIVENKATDYKELKVVIWDTFDELILLAEAESVRLYNKKNPEKKADTINAAWGGFGKGQDKAIEMILDMIWELKKVGVSSIIIGHVKRTDIVDPVTQETYSKLTADTTQKYFNAIKNKMHFVGLGYIDREVVKEKTGRKNAVTKQDITVNKAVSESRVISFRDDTYSVDSKSRFADIVDRIPFDCDAFIKAMKDAILAEQSKSGTSYKEAEKAQAKRDAEAKAKADEYSKGAKGNKIDVEKNEEIVSVIKTRYATLSPDKKKEFMALAADKGIQNFKEPEAIPTMRLEELVQYFD